MRLDFGGWKKIRCALKQKRGNKLTHASRFTHHVSRLTGFTGTKRENFPTGLYNSAFQFLIPLQIPFHPIQLPVLLLVE